MDVLNQIIEKLTKEEVRNFKLFYGESEEQRKDLLLFNYIRASGNNFSEEKAIKKLHYDTKNKNNYYRLKNRLIEDIGDSLSLLHTHKNELYELLQFIELFYIYRSRNLYKTCLFYLRKAERLANAIENYELLDIVYANFIQLTAYMIEIEPSVYIEKREKNAAIIADLRELDNLLATLSYRLIISQNFGAQDKDLLKKLQTKARDISKRTTSGFGKKIETQIYYALSKVLLQQHNYKALEKLVKDTYSKFEKGNWFDRSNHELKLQMLTFGANALYKNQKYKESLEYASKLGEEIYEYGKLHYDQYLFFHYNSLVLNYAVLDAPKALKALDEFEGEMRSKENNYYDFFIYLNRAGLLYDLKRYKESLKNLIQLYISDGYAKADKSFRLKIEVCELIITFESGETDTLAYRIEQVKKSFASLQGQPAFKTDFEIIELIRDMNDSINYRHDERLQKRIKALLKTQLAAVQADDEIISYRGWLERKLLLRH